MPTITIDASGNAIIDGVNKGHFFDLHHADAIRDRSAMLPTDPARASIHADLKAAFDMWHVTQRAMVDDAKRAHIADVEALNQTIGQLQQFSPAYQAAQKAAAIAAAQAKIAEAQAAIDALNSQP